MSRDKYLNQQLTGSDETGKSFYGAILAENEGKLWIMDRQMVKHEYPVITNSFWAFPF